MVIIKNKEAYAKIQKKNGQLEEVEVEATIKRKWYMVIIYKIRTAQIDIRKQSKAIKEIYIQNKSQKDQIKILAVLQARCNRDEVTTASLLLSVAELN